MNVTVTSELGFLSWNITLNQRLPKVATGMYNPVSEVMREALRLLQERDAMQAIRLEALRQDINKGMDSLERGEASPLDIEAIKAKGRAKQLKK